MHDYVIIDAHVHLWKRQNGLVEAAQDTTVRRPVFGVGNGKSDFGGEIRQMMPAYMTDNENNLERLLANMDYARVNAAVITQEYIDGNQDSYLLSVASNKRIKICALYEDYKKDCNLSRFLPFDGIKICGGRLENKDLKPLIPLFMWAQENGKFISIDMADGSEQAESLQYLVDRCPGLRVAIGHFGMVTRDGWQEQIKLARNRNVYIESGGITWLFHKEFYPYPSAVSAILEARDICSMDKLMWGSDYPRTMTDITYIMATRWIIESDRLTDAEKRAFLGENAARFYGFSDLSPMPVIENML